MSSVLMIAYHFPPEGNAASYRPLRFARQLPSLGWQPTVISLQTKFHERYDPALLSQIPGEIEVIRVRNRDPWQAFQGTRQRRVREQISGAPAEQATRIRSRHYRPARSMLREMVHAAEARLYHPDTAMGWIRPAVQATLAVCARQRPNIIWTTAGPVSSFIVAQHASQRTGIPYVLDFRDAWTITYNEFEERRPKWAQRRDRQSMFRLLEGAQAVVFRYDTEAECYWRAYQGALEPSKIHIIPNGYEGPIDKFSPPSGAKCKVLYTGTLSDYRYDTLLQALQLLKQSSPKLAKQLNFHFVGEGTDRLGTEVAAMDLAEIVTTSGPVSHKAIARLSREAHALLLLGRPAVMRGYELFAAAKLFGYLKMGRPIAGILPADEAKKILQRVGVSTVANVDSVTEIVALLRQLLVAWSEREFAPFIPDPTARQIYSAEQQTQALVRALEGEPALAPFVPGSVEIPASLREEISRRQGDRLFSHTPTSKATIASIQHTSAGKTL